MRFLRSPGSCAPLEAFSPTGFQFSSVGSPEDVAEGAHLVFVGGRHFAHTRRGRLIQVLPRCCLYWQHEKVCILSEKTLKTSFLRPYSTAGVGANVNGMFTQRVNLHILILELLLTKFGGLAIEAPHTIAGSQGGHALSRMRTLFLKDLKAVGLMSSSPLV